MRRSARQPRGDPRIVVSPALALGALGAGVVAGGVVAALGEPQLGPVVTWIVSTTVVLTSVWRLIWPLDHVGTERLAEQEARSRTTDSAILVAAGISLGAVVLALLRSAGGDQTRATIIVVLCVVAVALSWALVNTVFALKYARLYYLDDDGGIDFGYDEEPAYCDFAYLAFTVGMTFAVAETTPTTRHIRKVTLGHALLSYFFGTMVIAVAINLVTNLAQSS